MIKKLDRYIFLRLLSITVFVLLVLIFIFVVIDFSNNSDTFTDRQISAGEIFGVYYLNYIPEMIRLVIPVAVFVACLYLTGQMTDRLEITALKAAGISLYRLLLPYLAFALITTVCISYLDGFVIPDANSRRIAFEKQHLSNKSEKIDDNQIYRQENSDTIYKINYYNLSDQAGYRVETIEFKDDSISKIMDIRQMKWIEETNKWKLIHVNLREFDAGGFKEQLIDTIDTTLSIRPRDLARTTSDIYQLTYPEARSYIQSIEKSGASGIEDPQVKYFGRLVYPFSIIVVTIVGFAIASVRRRGGRGFHIAAGFTISFLYLALMKVIEPFGAQGTIDPRLASSFPHLFFLLVGLVLLFTAKK